MDKVAFYKEQIYKVAYTSAGYNRLYMTKDLKGRTNVKYKTPNRVPMRFKNERVDPSMSMVPAGPVKTHSNPSRLRRLRKINNTRHGLSRDTREAIRLGGAVDSKAAKEIAGKSLARAASKGMPLYAGGGIGLAAIAAAAIAMSNKKKHKDAE